MTQTETRLSTKSDYNTRVNFESAVKALIEGKRVYFLTWKNLQSKDRLALRVIGSQPHYVRLHVNNLGRIKDTTIVTQHEKDTPDWVVDL